MTDDPQPTDPEWVMTTEWAIRWQHHDGRVFDGQPCSEDTARFMVHTHSFPEDRKANDPFAASVVHRAVTPWTEVPL